MTQKALRVQHLDLILEPIFALPLALLEGAYGRADADDIRGARALRFKPIARIKQTQPTRLELRLPAPKL